MVYEMDTGTSCQTYHKPVSPVIFLQIEFDFTLDDFTRLELHILATNPVMLLWEDLQTYFAATKGRWALVNPILSHFRLYNLKL